MQQLCSCAWYKVGEVGLLLGMCKDNGACITLLHQQMGAAVAAAQFGAHLCQARAVVVRSCVVGCEYPWGCCWLQRLLRFAGKPAGRCQRRGWLQPLLAQLLLHPRCTQRMLILCQNRLLLLRCARQGWWVGRCIGCCPSCAGWWFPSSTNPLQYGPGGADGVLIMLRAL